MDHGAEQATDDASTTHHHQKAVSSLRSHFEALKAPSQVRNGAASPRLSPASLRVSETESSAPSTRGASFDLPRPASPWLIQHSGQTTPQGGPADRGRSQSPPKSGHRRPNSMFARDSPQLTPSVNIVSPRSPPRTLYARDGSVSPDRPAQPVHSKVRELVAQHSRSPSRPTAPTVERSESQDRTTLLPNAPTGAKAPPPINRADKPKIPAKPPIVSRAATSPSGVPTLYPEQRRPSSEARISPFSTPPSSDESPGSVPHSPPLATDISQRLVERGREAERPPADERQPPPEAPSALRMGFARTPTAPVRKDPRTLGLASPEPRPPSREAAQPARANTVSDRNTGRDARDLGFGAAVPKPQQRHVSENIRSTPPPPPTTPKIHSNPPRDARTLGFSGAAPAVQSVPEEPGPDLPPRPAIRAPPPRPPDETKAPSVRHVRQPSPAMIPDRSTKPIAAPQISKAPPIQIDSRFPPPPKRTNTDDLEKTTSPAPPPRPPRQSGNESESDLEEQMEPPATLRTDYPDATQANRRLPYYKSGLREINARADSRAFDVCGRYLCVAGYTTKVFDMSTGEQLTGIHHGETVKATAVAFKPAADLDGEGKRIWVGNNAGDLQEIDVFTHTVLSQSSAHNRREIVQIHRHHKDLWTLDDEGKLFIWLADERGSPDLKYRHISHKVQRGHTFSLVAQNLLWHATGKEVRVYRPGNEAQFAPLSKPLSQYGSGDITSGAFFAAQGGKVYFGHTDGKITIYSAKDFSCLGSTKASDYKINALAAVGDNLWVAYKTGKIYVYDTNTTPWKVHKDWRAHDGPVTGLMLDASSVWTLDRLQATSIGHDGYARFWDGLLEDDWIENSMHEKDVQYCTFREVRAAVVTWNVGASTPYDLKSDFIADAIHSEDPPEILVFGFQEVVDLEDRAVTAKSLFGFGKKKDIDSTEQHQSRVYREWRDYLSKIISRFTSSSYRYAELHTSNLIGLFQCIFIRLEERPNLKDVSAINVKCGMKGHYGNKGALVTRFILDDSSLCFVNCHLAAGQTQTSHRNNDVATILESENLPPERDPDARMSFYVGGGDGTQLLDHEICILNGDLNYRIDAIPRDTVIKMIQRGELSKLMDRDQIMVSRRRVSGFRLAPFVELPITFAPTYKYDVGTDSYDSSEKKRAPAWCDRLLYRGPGRVKQVEYRRHEVRVSDHRPVSGVFQMRIKTIDQKKRQKVKERCYEEFKEAKKVLMERMGQAYLVGNLGVSQSEAKRLLGRT